MNGDLISKIGTIVKDIGFPIVIALLLLLRLEPAMTALTNAVNWSTYVMTEVQKRLAEDEKDREVMRLEHERILSHLRSPGHVPAPRP